MAKKITKKAERRPQEIRYMQLCVAGKKHNVAYLEAFPEDSKLSKRQIDAKASQLYHRPDMQQLYLDIVKELNDKTKDLLQEERDNILLSYTEKRKLLAVIARDADVSPDVRIKAIDTDNKMEGIYVQKQDVKANIAGSVGVTVSQSFSDILNQLTGKSGLDDGD